jgi:hypothetical protein
LQQPPTVFRWRLLFFKTSMSLKKKDNGS